VEYSSDKSKYLHGSNPAAMASMVDLYYKFDPLRAVELDCEPLVGDKVSQPRKVLIKVEQQLEQAIKHAELRAFGDPNARPPIPPPVPPVFIGIEIGPNAKAVLSALRSDKGLEDRAKRLFDHWDQEIAKKHESKQRTATQRYTASKEGGVGALLASNPESVLREEFDMAPYASALNARLKSTGVTSADREKKFDEVKEEVQKLDGRVRQLGILNQSIKDQMRALEKELEKPEIKGSSADLDRIAKQLDGLIANREALGRDLAKICDEKKAGIAANYSAWLDQGEVAGALGVDLDAKEKPDIILQQGQTEKDVRAADAELDGRCKAFEKREAYLKLREQTTKAGATANGTREKNQDTAREMTALKSKIEGFQSTLKQQALVAQPEAPEPQEVKRHGMV